MLRDKIEGLQGPAPLSTHNGMKWFITFVADSTRMTGVYLLRHKSDVCVVYLLFHQMVLTQFGISIYQDYSFS